MSAMVVAKCNKIATKARAILCEIFHVFMHMCSGKIECEPPNNRLHKFVGVLTMKDDEQSEDTGEKYPLDNDKILLRVSFFC